MDCCLKFDCAELWPGMNLYSQDVPAFISLYINIFHRQTFTRAVVTVVLVLLVVVLVLVVCRHTFLLLDKYLNNACVHKQILLYFRCIFMGWWVKIITIMCISSFFAYM